MNTNVEWHYPPGYDVTRWGLRHAAGEVPCRLPYGVEHLRQEERTLTWKTSAPLGFTGQMRTVLGLSGLGHRTTREGCTVDITWEESNAPRMLVQGTSSRKYAGVIWLTDPADDPKVKLRQYAQRHALKQLDGLWCLSRPQVALVKDLLGRGSPDVHFLQFGIDEEFFTPTPYDGADGVLSIGNDRDRDPVTLLHALSIVHRVRPRTPLRVQTNYAGVLPEGITRLPRMPHDALRSEYARAAVVALATRPNHHVSGMTTVLEAGATGRPVVISETSGVADYVTDGETGHLVPPSDPAVLAARIIELLDERSIAAQMGMRGRAKVVAGHTARGMMESLANLILAGGR